MSHAPLTLARGAPTQSLSEGTMGRLHTHMWSDCGHGDPPGIQVRLSGPLESFLCMLTLHIKSIACAMQAL